MKKILILTLLVYMSVGLLAQKYAYVDTEYILDNIPEYKDAQVQLDDMAEEFQEELELKYSEIDKMYKNYKAEAVLLPEDIKEKKLKQIQDAEAQVKDLQKQMFGVEGDLFLKREELVKPIQEKIYNAIEEIASEQNYAFVFDKAGSLSILYVNAKYDLSDDILDAVGAELGTVRREDRVRQEYKPSPATNKPINRPSARPGSGPGGMKLPSTVRGSERK